MRIIDNVQPSRQTVMFSATFPRQVEALAKKILSKPIEITVMAFVCFICSIHFFEIILSIDNILKNT